MSVFNEHLDASKRRNGDNQQDDERDNGNVMTFGVNDDVQDPQEINIEDDKKQFAFDHKEEAPVESPFSSKVTDGFGGKFSGTHWGNTFGGGGDQNGSDEKADKVNEESNSFANINWNLGGDTTISTFDTNTTAATTQQPAGDTNA